MPSFKATMGYVYYLSGLDIFRAIVFPIYASRLGLSDLQIGLILTIFTVASLIAYYPASLLTEKYGAKLALYITYVAYFLSLLGMAYATSFEGFTASYIVLSLAQAFIVQRNTLILANTGSQDELNAVFSFVSGTSLIGDITGSLSVMALYFYPAIANFRLSFIALGTLWLTPIPFMRGVRDSNRARKLVLSPQRDLLAYSTVSLIAGFGENIIVTLLQLYYDQLGVNLLGISLIYVLLSAAGYAGTVLAGRLSGRVIAGYIASAIVYAVAAPLIGLPLVYSLVAVSVFSFARYMRNSLGSVIRGEILRAINQVEKGYGMASITSTLGDSAGTFLQGYLFSQAEYELPFLIGGVTMLFGSLLHYYFYTRYVGGLRQAARLGE